MADTPPSLQGKLEEIRHRFAAALPKRLAEVQALAELAMQDLEAVEAVKAFEALRFPVHKLAGAGASMGYSELSEKSARLEKILVQWIDAGVPVTENWRELLTQEIDALTEASAEPDAPEVVTVSEASTAAIAVDAEELSVLVLCGDRADGEGLSSQLGRYGYAVGDYHDVDGFLSGVRHVRPSAMVVDLEIAEGLEQGLSALEAAVAARPDVPVVAVTAHNDIETLLRIVRAGTATVLQHPVDVHDVVHALDIGTARDVEEPYRVLIVEDDEDMAYFYAVLLREAGHEAEIVTNPLDVLEPLNAFEPDVILMDVHMPHCSGIELASVIRQSRSYLQIPIIFLTSERSVRTHLYALRAGGDDYLLKPVDRAMLLASLGARARRSRQLKTLISSDSMTGLLNHSSIMEALDTELSRAKRQQRPVSFAMIDIDHFKAVNDTHGHWIGDMVIKALSQVLRQRLRRTDVIGRYGGEEFAAILPDTDEAQAARLLDRIRDSFGKIQHRNGDQVFHVTFSCGVASFPAYDEQGALATAADETLYKAKQAGRNRVFRASESLGE